MRSKYGSTATHVAPYRDKKQYQRRQETIPRPMWERRSVTVCRHLHRCNGDKRESADCSQIVGKHSHGGST